MTKAKQSTLCSPKIPLVWPLSALALATALSCALPAQAQGINADEKQELAALRATTQALIEALVGQGLITRERADAIVKQAQQQQGAPAVAQWGTPLAASAGAAAGAGAAQKVVRVPYVPETARQQMRDEIKTEVLAQAKSERWGEPGAMPDWLGRIRLGGDMRVRAQGDMFDEGNVPAAIYRAQTSSPAWAPDLSNTTTNRERMTLRARLDVDALLSDQVQAGMRVSTGGLTGPTSTSQTLGGGGGGFNRYALTLDRAWLHWQPPVGFQGLSADFGRMPNPFYSSDLTWSDDLNFDGIAANMKHYVSPQQGFFANAGLFALEELNLSSRDKWLMGAQVGGEFTLAKGMQLKLGLAIYEFKSVEGVRETEPLPSGPRVGTVNYFASQYPAGWRQKGNTLININDPTSVAAPTWGLASKFRPVNLTAGLSLAALAPVMLNFNLDWVENTGFDIKDVRQRAGMALTDLEAKTTAVQARVQAGSAKLAKRGDWQSFLTYRYMERDAWVDAFTDTTWHLGGTNYKGWSMGANYAFDRNFWLSGRWTSTRNLDDNVRFLALPGDPTSVSGNLSSAPLRIDVIQLDLNARF
ncbi:putative porin [Roseateles oligotrophus]|uniref:Porin n=1 Tax=Roseateles oligotrophus TaxID=1769250 RepID=A0ABT2YAH0_9BURK|nr:putative porin [Roseateles oligotrophus]MCV2367296.1 putative porin [Roseateles oligotrophus]